MTKIKLLDNNSKAARMRSNIYANPRKSYRQQLATGMYEFAELEVEFAPLVVVFPHIAEVIADVGETHGAKPAVGPVTGFHA